jgi:putative RecB family exonuclease
VAAQPGTVVDMAASTASAGDGVDCRDALPVRLSPSRASDFVQCPAKFYFRSILRLPSPSTAAQLRGTLTHAACEKIFDHPRAERTPDLAVTYVRPAWDEIAGDERYAELVPEIETIIADAESMTRAWFGVEDPTRFDPHDREVRLNADVAGVPLVGIIDRLDRLHGPDGDRWVISDYKTGKVPAPDDRFMNEKFFGMEVYAVLLRATAGHTPAALRLVFVAGGTPDSVRSRPVTDDMVARTEARLKSLWRDMQRRAADGYWPCKTQPLCNWCEYQNICPAWNPAMAGAQVGDASADR